MMGLGSRIADARHNAGLTQAQLADAVGRSIHAVRKWEQGENQPSLDKLEEIARITNCPLAFLVGIEQEDSGENGGANDLRAQVRARIRELEALGDSLADQPLNPGVEALADDEHVREMYGITDDEVRVLRTCIIGCRNGSFVVMQTIRDALRLLETVRSFSEHDE